MESLLKYIQAVSQSQREFYQTHIFTISPRPQDNHRIQIQIYNHNLNRTGMHLLPLLSFQAQSPLPNNSPQHHRHPSPLPGTKSMPSEPKFMPSNSSLVVSQFQRSFCRPFVSQIQPSQTWKNSSNLQMFLPG